MNKVKITVTCIILAIVLAFRFYQFYHANPSYYDGQHVSFTTTFSAQLGTLPILLGVFGQIGLLSVFVNALVLWTIPILMIFGSLAAIIGLVFPFLGQLLLYPILPFLVYFQSVVSYF